MPALRGTAVVVISLAYGAVPVTASPRPELAVPSRCGPRAAGLAAQQQPRIFDPSLKENRQPTVDRPQFLIARSLTSDVGIALSVDAWQRVAANLSAISMRAPLGAEHQQAGSVMKPTTDRPAIAGAARFWNRVYGWHS
jgi:hypothetical protein